MEGKQAKVERKRGWMSGRGEICTAQYKQKIRTNKKRFGKISQHNSMSSRIPKDRKSERYPLFPILIGPKLY